MSTARARSRSPELKARADLADRGRLLDDDHRQPELRERERSREAPDPTADDDHRLSRAHGATS